MAPPLQYSCLENPVNGGAWWAAVHGVEKSQTWLSDFTFTFYFYALEKEMATHSSVLAWRIPGMGSHRVRHDWSDLAAAAYVILYIKQITSKDLLYSTGTSTHTLLIAYMGKNLEEWCVVQLFSHVALFEMPWTSRLPSSSPYPRACWNSRPLSWWCHPTILSSVPFSTCLWSFPASGSFPMSQLFASGGQRSNHLMPKKEWRYICVCAYICVCVCVCVCITDSLCCTTEK